MSLSVLKVVSTWNSVRMVRSFMRTTGCTDDIQEIKNRNIVLMVKKELQDNHREHGGIFKNSRLENSIRS